MKTIIIGIAGGTGSGKTTLTEKLRDHFGANEVSVLNHDSYYKRHDELPYEERCKLNYDHPDSFDTPLMVAHLRELRAGHPVQVPVYDYTIHNRSDKTVTVQPAPVIIVEGILIFDSPRAVRLNGHEGLCGHRRRCAHPAPHRPRRQGARAHAGQRCQPVPDHCQTDARAVRRAEQAQGRPDRPRRRA